MALLCVQNSSCNLEFVNILLHLEILIFFEEKFQVTKTFWQCKIILSKFVIDYYLLDASKYNALKNKIWKIKEIEKPQEKKKKNWKKKKIKNPKKKKKKKKKK